MTQQLFYPLILINNLLFRYLDWIITTVTRFFLSIIWSLLQRKYDCYMKQKKFLKTMLNFIVVLVVALVGFIKVTHPLSYLIGVPAFAWVTYLLSNAMWTDLLFGERYGAKKWIKRRSLIFEYLRINILKNQSLFILFSLEQFSTM